MEVDVQSGRPRSFITLLCALAVTACVQARGGSTDAWSSPAERDREVAVLVAQATPSDLAAAALLLQLPHDDLTAKPSLDLIERSETLAPQRPDLVWLHLMICERLKCDARAQIATHLQALDPDNGFAWLPDLERAQPLGPEAVTAAMTRIGASPRMTSYFNQLEVMLVDALAVANPSQKLVARGITAIGIVAALSIPPLQPISRACQPAQLDLPGRRKACEMMVEHMERSSTILTQGMALGLQERWWAPESPERRVLRAKRRRFDYLLTMSSRTRWWRENQDMALRIEAARQSDREEDVELAVVKSLGLPLEPPASWKDTLHPASDSL